MTTKAFFNSIKPRIFLELMLFYWVLLAVGLLPNPLADGQGHSFALYTLVAAAFSLIHAWVNGLGDKSDVDGRRDQHSA